MGFDGRGADSEWLKMMSARSHKLRLVRATTAVAESEDLEEGNRTPTAKEARIERLTCPSAPRKRRSGKWSGGVSVVVREYLSVPDLESVFVVRRQSSTAN